MHDAIHALLERHTAADATEREHRGTMLQALEHGARSIQRSWFDPGHFTASAFVLAPDRDALLLVFHSKLRRWLQPGGHLETRDTDPLAAARREVLEETGLDALEPAGEGLLDVDVHSIPARPGEPAHLHLDLRFAFVAPHAVAIAGDGVDAARFVSLAELDAIATDESVRRAVRKLVPEQRQARGA